MDGPESYYVDDNDHTAEMSGAVRDIGEEDDVGGRPKKSLVQERTISQSYSIRHPKKKDVGKWGTLWLAYETLGVIYGDVGTSPLYTFAAIDIANPGEVDFLGYLSIIFWSITLVSLTKYVLIVIRADDHGEGGTFALYSLLCRHVDMRQNAGKQFGRFSPDSSLTNFGRGNGLSNLNYKTKEILEKSAVAQRILLIFVIIGTCMVIGDGALTPEISVISAVQGIQQQNSKLTKGFLEKVYFQVIQIKTSSVDHVDQYIFENVGNWGTLWLAYETLGIIYGDIGTSPLYTFASIDMPAPGEIDILGYLSIIYWSLTLIGLIKYVCIVIRADDYGED